MTPLRIALLGATAGMVPATPAMAQHQGHTMESAPPTSATCAPEHAAAGHCTLTPPQQPAPPKSQPVPQSQAGPRAPSTCLPEHAAAGHCTPAPPPEAARTAPQVPPAPQPTCLPEHAALGHCTPAAPPPAAQPPSTCLPEHAAMGHCTPAAPGAAEGTDLPAGNAPPPAVPIANAADAIYGTSAMEMGRHHLNEFHGGQKLSQVMFNIAEAQSGKGPTGFEWDAEGWYGGDINRLWVKSEGEGAFGRSIEKAEVQALYSHAIGPYFNLQGGLRYDFKPSPSRVYAVAGFEGLAPSFFDVEGTLFLSNKGELMARAEGYYDQRITQRLILQPRAELDFAAQSSREIGVGAGLSDAEVGLRLRYDIRREFAPYVGVQYRRAFGRTARYLREEGEDVGGFKFLLGVRTWF